MLYCYVCVVVVFAACIPRAAPNASAPNVAATLNVITTGTTTILLVRSVCVCVCVRERERVCVID